MAQNFYVAPDGNNSWAGTEDKPFKSIQTGVDALKAGDTLFVKNGTYVEEVDISRSGTASQPITVRAYPGHKPVIDGQAGVNGINAGLPAGQLQKINPKTGAGAKFAGLFDVTGSYIVVDGFEIARSMGRGVRVYAPAGQETHHVTIRNCNIHHSRQTNLLFTGFIQGNGHTLHDVAVEGTSLSWSGNYYPERRAANSSTDWSACVVFKATSDGRVSNCKVYENWGEALIADANTGRSRGIIVEDSVFYDNMKGIYFHAVSDVVFQRNFVYRSANDRSSSNSFGPTNGVKVSPAEQDRFSMIPSKNIQILNNIVVGYIAGLSFAGNENKSSIENCLIAYNTTVSNDTNIFIRIVNHKDFVFRNNLSTGKGNMVDDDGRTATGWTFSHNLWSKKPTAMNSPDDVIGDPKLVNENDNPSAGKGNPDNYKLTAFSPAINAGYKLREPNDDFFKNPRGATPDIGGSEFGVPEPFILADFDANPKSGDAPLSVTFSDRSSSSSPITTWLWDFGDGTISSQQNPMHTYDQGTYTVSLRVTSQVGDDMVTKQDFIASGPTTPTTPPRITDGLVAYYRLDEKSGNILHDVSGAGTPLDLRIRDEAAVRWLEEGLGILSPTLIASTGTADKIIEACRLSNEISIEAWLKPANAAQKGPARIISISQNPYSRNATLSQGLWGNLPGNLYDIRLRTTDRSANGMPSFSSSEGSLTAEKSHVVFTRSRTGSSRIFINATLVAETVITGDLSTWNPRFPMLLVNETTQDYPWLGELYLVAVFDRALRVDEVKQNYDAGSKPANGLSSSSVILLPEFKRFFISNANGSNGNGGAVVAYGVQYPDRRCVTCVNNGDHEMSVHANLKAALRSFATDETAVTWVD